MRIRRLLLVFLPTVLLSSTIAIHILEYQLTGDEETQYRSLFNSLYWTVVTVATVGFGDMSPQTFGGRFFTLFLIAGGVVQYSLLVSLATSKLSEFRSARERGLEKIRLSGHVLVCSDNPAWITKILEQHRDLVAQNRIVIISPLTSHPLLTTDYNTVRWVSGNPQQVETLLKASVASAHLAYAYFEDTNLTLITVLQLETLSKGRIVTLAQYVGQDFRKYFADVGCDHAVDPYDLYVPMMLQAYRSQGAASWIRAIVHHTEGHRLVSHPLPAEYAGKPWMDYLLESKRVHGHMLLGIVLEGTVLINPSPEHNLRRDCQIIRLESPATRAKGEREEDSIDVIGMDDIRLDGHVLLISDNALFLERMLEEIALSKMHDHVVVVSPLAPIKKIPEDLPVEWITDHDGSEESFRKSRAALAKVAFIEHHSDGQTLMTVMQLEQVTDGEIFTIAAFRDEGFDTHLLRVGCDFCMKFDDLVAPLLTQSASQVGLANLITQTLSQNIVTQSCMVRQLSYEWNEESWLDTIATIKRLTGRLPVGLIRRGTNKLLINPHTDLWVRPGDRLIFMAQEAEIPSTPIFELNHVDQTSHFTPPKPPSPEDPLEPELLIEEALATLRRGGHAKLAVRLLQRAATYGHPEAKYQLGIMNFRGWGLPKNLDEAHYWFREAARNGHEQAQSVLSTIRILRETEKRFEEIDDDIPEFSTEMLAQLDAPQRRWFARMVVATVQVDQRIDLHERAFLHSAIQLIADTEEVPELEEFILLGTCPPVEEIQLPEGLRHQVLDSLLNVATIDRHFDEAEETLLREIAAATGCDEQAIEQLIEVGHTRVHQFHSTQLHAPNARARI